MIKLNPDGPEFRLIRFHIAPADREQFADIASRRFKFKRLCLLFLLGILLPHKRIGVPAENQLARKGLPGAQIFHRDFDGRRKVQRMARISANPFPEYSE